MKAVNAVATQGLVPDLTVMIDIDPAVGLERAQDKNRFEARGTEVSTESPRGISESARVKIPTRWLVIKPGTKTPEQLASIVIATLEKKFKSRLEKVKRG